MRPPTKPVPREGRARTGTLRAATAAALAVFAFWLIVSASLDPADLAAGALLAVLLGWWSARFLWAGAPPVIAPGVLLGLPGHLVRLAGEVVVAALHVARLVLDPRLRVAPRLLRIRTGLRSPAARITFALSLTLTPGTLAIDLEDGVFLVHCLDEASAERLLDGALERRIARVFGEEAGP
ncbi:Na+/H+ antiporter subunit E [Thioalkalivibrio sp. XN8]|uniref:Na+/H+ antiporter subunit E n=1 Tax=Thioalkalivibrio sp. XN8 TaxID=2712863 RepID=UPI0013EA09D4|nr:Na+/H+ antiporter subunit E [Thioalkalivibrio sp. XN8]NGP52677.1 Na+/H+ antiporter subunit E [Thioalkalivibrio sp. XN8]